MKLRLSAHGYDKLRLTFFDIIKLLIGKKLKVSALQIRLWGKL